MTPIPCIGCGLDLDDVTGDVCLECEYEIEPEIVLQLMLRRVEGALAALHEAPRSAPETSRMTSHEAAGFYRFPSVKALWMATQRHPARYPHERRGRRILYIRPEAKR